MTEVNTNDHTTDALHASILAQIEKLKALAEREMTTEVAAQGQLIADVIGEAFEQIATGEPETLTEQELWQKFVNSKVQLKTRYGLTDDTYNPRHLLDDGVMLQEEIELINEQLFSDDGSGVIDAFIDDLEAYLKNLKTIRDTFESEKDALLITDEDDDVLNGEYRYRVPDWKQA
jgi:hypothetical protein